MTSGARIKRLRRKLGITQELLGQAAGVHNCNLANIENGKRRLSPKMERRLRAALERLRAGKLHVVSRLSIRQAKAVLSGRGR